MQIPIDRGSMDEENRRMAKKIKNFIYDPLNTIGSGFSSQVHHGMKDGTSESVAIKVIELGQIKNEVEKYLLNNQINALRALNHKNILKTQDILMTKNNVYIVTEYCEDGDLQKMIKRKGKLSELQALSITKDLSDGYKLILQKSIVHRDLKTANVFLSKGNAKIADFGFCQFINQRKPQVVYNVGSPAYMSPQSYKDNIYSDKSDIWAIGIILYEMLVGETPDKNLTYMEMANNLINGRIHMINNESIVKLLCECFKKELNQRINIHSLYDSVCKIIQDISKSTKTQKQSQRNVKINQMNQFIPQENNVKMQHEIINKQRQQQQQQEIQQQILLQSIPQNQRFQNQIPQLQMTQYQIPQQSLQIEINKGSISDARKRTNEQNKRQPSQRLNIDQYNQQMNSNQTVHKIRRKIPILLFLYRLRKYISDHSLQNTVFLRIILFRHRLLIDSEIQRIVLDHNINKDTSQIYKQFLYLKNKFDETYFQTELQGKQQQQKINENTLRQLNELSNTSITQQKVIMIYTKIILQSCQQCSNQCINVVNSSIGLSETVITFCILWDYLLLECQILHLYWEGCSNEMIVQNKIPFDIIMKQKPKVILSQNIELLRVKTQLLYDHNNHINNYYDN